MRQDKRNIIIGLCDGDQKKDKILGFGKGAYGYQADTRLMHNEKDRAILLGQNGGGEILEPGFDEKDVVGCGLLIDKRQIFFTKNGALLDIAFKDVDIPKKGLYPAICL